MTPCPAADTAAALVGEADDEMVAYRPDVIGGDRRDRVQAYVRVVIEGCVLNVPAIPIPVSDQGCVVRFPGVVVVELADDPDVLRRDGGDVVVGLVGHPV